MAQLTFLGIQTQLDLMSSRTLLEYMLQSFKRLITSGKSTNLTQMPPETLLIGIGKQPVPTQQPQEVPI